MKMAWAIDDGYMGSRPQFTEIPDEELEDLNEDERQKLIEKYVQDDFDLISWHYLRGYED